MIVVDASALLEALLRTPAARAVEERLFEPQQTLHAPHLLDIEVAQVIRRYAAKGEIDSERGRAALADLADFPFRRYPHDFLLPRVGGRESQRGRREPRSEEHTSELQSLRHLVCRLLLEKKKSSVSFLLPPT